ncbi:MAG: hypothetical protein H8E27_13615 [Verrucomicrobia subdivision 3 bacterium]|nr:hypothetical protein [Limisphaerales bacterium]
MKTTIEMPDTLFRQAKAKAALQGKSMKQFVNEAVQQQVEKSSEGSKAKPKWMKGFGVMKKYPGAREELDAVFDAPDFRPIEKEDWE